MTAKKDPIEDIRSDVVQEILNNPPNWMISWGITLLFLLFAMVLGISWFIKYPDVIKGNVVLTTEIPPVKLVCKSSGQLQNIYAQEGQVVQKGAFIAKIEDILKKRKDRTEFCVIMCFINNKYGIKYQK